MRLIDSHCHLDVAEFAADLPETLERAGAAGVSDFIVPAIAASGWPALAAMLHQRAASAGSGALLGVPARLITPT